MFMSGRTGVQKWLVSAQYVVHAWVHMLTEISINCHLPKCHVDTTENKTTVSEGKKKEKKRKEKHFAPQLIYQFHHKLIGRQLFGLMAAWHGLFPFITVRVLAASAVLQRQDCGPALSAFSFSKLWLRWLLTVTYGETPDIHAHPRIRQLTHKAQHCLSWWTVKPAQVYQW